MPKNNVYVEYSGATDNTGKALVKELNAIGGTNKGKGKVILGWGAKTSENVSYPPATKVFNHPNYIRVNRNKFRAMQVMQKAGVPIMDFVKAEDVYTALKDKKGKITFPLVGRRNYHQGGKDFFPCMFNNHVQIALEDAKPAQYFQNMIDIADEYRMHIVGENVILAQKKIPRDNPKEAFKKQVDDSIRNAAERKGLKLDEATVELILEQLSKREQGFINYITRSNTKGWKFAQLDVGKTDAKFKNPSIAALKALNLDYGAVDCCIDTAGKVWILEVNSAPGLKGISLTTWKTELKKLIDAVLAPPKVQKAAMPQKLKLPKGGPPKKAGVKVNGAKAKLAAKLEAMQALLEVADDAQAATLNDLIIKLG